MDRSPLHRMGMQTTGNDHHHPNRVACGSDQSYGYQEAKESIDGAIGVLPVLAAGTLAFAHGLSRSSASWPCCIMDVNELAVEKMLSNCRVLFGKSHHQTVIHPILGSIIHYVDSRVHSPSYRSISVCKSLLAIRFYQNDGACPMRP